MKVPQGNADLPARPVIAIVGTGAIGSYYGGRLAQHGHEVHFLLRTDYETVVKKGLVVHSSSGDFSLSSASIHAHQDARQMPKVDLVIVTLKSTANDQFPSLIAPLLRDHTAILTLQNGLGNEEQLASLFGAERVLGGVAFICATRPAAGVIDHTAHGRIKLGEFIADSSLRPAAPSSRAATLANLFAASTVPCEAVAEIRRARWEKLVWNIPFNGLSALLDQTTDRLLANERGLALVKELMSEVIAIAARCGFDFALGLADKQIANTLEMGSYRTSSHIDRRANRALELEAIWGWPLRFGMEKNVSTPKLSMLYDLLKMTEASYPV